MGVTRTMHNYPKGRVNCHILLKKSLITRKFPSMITRCVNGVLVKSTSTHGVHICSPLVKRPIWPMVQTEIIVREIFRSSSFSQIQPVKPNMQKISIKKKELWGTCHNKDTPCCSMRFNLEYLAVSSTYWYDIWFRWKGPRKSFSDLLHFTKSNQYSPRHNNQ